MSDDENFSLHSFDPNEEDDHIEQFYKELSLQFYAQEKKENKKKVSLLLSGSTEPTSKPSKDTLPDLQKGIIYLPQKVSQTSRPGSAKSQRQSSNRSPLNRSPANKNIYTKRTQQGSPVSIRPSMRQRIHDNSTNQTNQAQKLIKLLQSPYNNSMQFKQQNQKQAYIQKQLEIIRNLQINELKDHYYK